MCSVPARTTVPSMFEVRIHGRGGQGVVTAAELLSVAAFLEGKHAQAFPTFGSERMGAPVTSFCRIDEKPIRLREPIVAPDALIVQDPTLLHQVDLFGGVGAAAYVIINTARTLEELGLEQFAERFEPERVLTVPATDLAREHVGRPLPNAALLGAFSRLTDVVTIASVCAAIGRRFQGETAERNAAAATAAFTAVRPRSQEVAHA
jgi:pyruvate ferredoxin oxidoreductase gamma subunit